MGHLVAKEAYLRLGKKIDGLETRAPRNDRLAAILQELYTPTEAELVATMPYGLAALSRVAKVTGFPEEGLEALLRELAHKGLVVDVWTGKEYLYSVSPMIVGIFEFTMMRTGGKLDFPKWAGLFSEYMDASFYGANFGKGQVISPLRALPYEAAFEGGEYLEVLDFERAREIIETGGDVSVGLCSCRHEALHRGARRCDVPLETCLSFGRSADYLVRNGLARMASAPEAIDIIARSRDMGLTMCADNVQKDVSFICNCCKCCCNALAGIREFGYASAVMTSNYIAHVEPGKCTGCGACARACTIDAIKMRDAEPSEIAAWPSARLAAKIPVVDVAFCLGCGACAVKCPSGAMRLKPRAKRVLHPADVFERVILRSLENGTLQNLMFDDPEKLSQKFLRGLIGGFLRLSPVKRSLMGDNLRSRFLAALSAKARPS